MKYLNEVKRERRDTFSKKNGTFCESNGYIGRERTLFQQIRTVKKKVILKFSGAMTYEKKKGGPKSKEWRVEKVGILNFGEMIGK